MRICFACILSCGIVVGGQLSVWADDDLVQTVITLVSDADKDVRSVGLEQVRDEVKGADATGRFAALLPKLAPDAQVALLGALAGRGDATAKSAVVALIGNARPEVDGAAIRALGSLGDATDVPRLTKLLAENGREKDAAAALERLRGGTINAALCSEMKSTLPLLRAKLLQALVARHAIDAVPALLESAHDADAGVRAAALDALGQLGGTELVPKLARLFLDASDKTSREEVEKALVAVSLRNSKLDEQALPLLAATEGMNGGEKTMLLSALGRIGGKPALKVVAEAVADKSAERHSAGLKALCNWPDGSVAPSLLKFAQSADDKSERTMALDALIRIAPLPDKRSPSVRLSMLEKTMNLAATDAQRTAIIKRARAIRTVETLRFVAPYMDQPRFAQVACETVVELAHHKELRQPNKPEFDKALDKVLTLSKNATILLRAQRYLKDETWVEKQIQPPAAGK